MSKKTRRLLKAKNLKKAIRRNGTAIGVTALALGGIAAAALSPGVRARTRQLKEMVVHRLEARRTASAPLANGSMERNMDRPVITTSAA